MPAMTMPDVGPPTLTKETPMPNLGPPNLNLHSLPAPKAPLTSAPESALTPAPKAVQAVKPQVLTHIIDGHVIKESSQPFPVSPSKKRSANGKPMSRAINDIQKMLDKDIEASSLSGAVKPVDPASSASWAQCGEAGCQLWTVCRGTGQLGRTETGGRHERD
jgi:hypothetical protein